MTFFLSANYRETFGDSFTIGPQITSFLTYKHFETAPLSRYNNEPYRNRNVTWLYLCPTFFFLYKINPRNRTKVFKLFPGVSWSSSGETRVWGSGDGVRENEKQRVVKIIT